MTTPVIVSRALKTLKAYSPEVLTGLSISGVVTTAYLTGKATVQATKVSTWETGGPETKEERYERYKENIKRSWKFYIPAGASGIATVGCILAVQRVGSRRAAAAATAYAIAERTLSEYRDQVVEEFSKTRDQKIMDKVVQDRVDEKPPSNQIVISGSGRVLCCELFTHRYFYSDMETLKKAQSWVNNRVLGDLYVMMSEFYDHIGLEHTSQSDYLGWDQHRELELRFSPVISEAGDPCIGFDYNYTMPL